MMQNLCADMPCFRRPGHILCRYASLIGLYANMEHSGMQTESGPNQLKI